MHEIGLVLQWLTSTLLADTTLASLAPGGVWRAMAPTTVSSSPFVTLNFQAGSDITTINGYRIWSSQLYQVRASGPAKNTANIVQAASRLDTVLGGIIGHHLTSITDGIIYSCIRESPLMLDELVNGEQWSNVGGLYRLQVQQA